MSAAAGFQAVSEIVLYGIKGTADTHNDIATIMATFGAAADQERKKILFYSAVLDTTITNVSELSGVAEVDVYEFVFRKAITDDNWLDRATLAMQDQETMSTMLTYTIGTRGWTPFQACLALKYIRILKKTKFFIGNGQAITYQMRDPSNRWYSGQDLSDPITIWPGKTKGIIIIGKGLIDGAGVGTACNLAVGYTKSYNFTVQENENAGKGLI